ncbi:MAG: AMP-binding protein [Casimicrobiaceae bacterium]
MTTNIANYFTQHFAQPARVLHRHFSHGEWRDVTVADVRRYAERWQQALRREGLVAGDRVVVAARNGTFWVSIDLAALGLGLVVVPLYVDDNPDNVAWCAHNADARLFIADSTRMADALTQLAGQYPLPRLLVLRADDGDARGVEHFLPVDAPAFECRALEPQTLATICYTSGTSGRPKGVMLSHANIIANVEQCRATGLARADDLFLSILPLSHMFERTGGYYLPLAMGARVAYSRGIAQIPEDLVSQSPTAMFAVPRIFEKFLAKVRDVLAKSPPWKVRLFNACVTRGYRVASGHPTLVDRISVPLLRALVAKPVLAKLGGRMRLAVVGGAALDPVLARTFIGLGLTVLQGYGMTEASPVISVNLDRDNVPESVGPALPGVEVKIGDNSELLARGGNVMLGYWRNDEASRASLADGWLRTGDIAQITDGHIFIRGRAKDILVMSNGEKVSPQDAELAILQDPAFEQVMLVGEGKPYPILLAVSAETDERALQERANDRLKAFPRWVRVRRVIATRDPWTVGNGLLTPTQKLKRPVVEARFQPAIEAAYSALTDREPA